MESSVESLKKIKIEAFDYPLPNERIARYPLTVRENSQLLIYDRHSITDKHFYDVRSLLQKGDTLIFNNTKVIYARLFFQKTTGAVIEIFCLEPIEPADYAQNFASSQACEWICLIGNAKKWKSGNLECTFEHDGLANRLTVEHLESRADGKAVIRFSWLHGISFSEVLEQCGRIPIPPYLHRDSEESDKTTYQTIYSKFEGSVAAPTAGLHFTGQLLDDLRAKGIRTNELTLHVGAGTFKPVKSVEIGDHDMHTEHILVTRTIIDTLLQRTSDVIAVGTTSVRTLESLYWMGVKCCENRPDYNTLGQWEAYTLPQHHPLDDALAAIRNRMEADGTEVFKAATTIMIVPGYRFRVINAMFTNFHQPQSTLLLLVCAAVGDAWHQIYRHALDHGYRFLSYGDSSFLRIDPSAKEPCR